MDQVSLSIETHSVAQRRKTALQWPLQINHRFKCLPNECNNLCWTCRGQYSTSFMSGVISISLLIPNSPSGVGEWLYNFIQSMLEVERRWNTLWLRRPRPAVAVEFSVRTDAGSTWRAANLRDETGCQSLRSRWRLVRLVELRFNIMIQSEDDPICASH